MKVDGSVFRSTALWPYLPLVAKQMRYTQPWQWRQCIEVSTLVKWHNSTFDVQVHILAQLLEDCGHLQLPHILLIMKSTKYLSLLTGYIFDRHLSVYVNSGNQRVNTCMNVHIDLSEVVRIWMQAKVNSSQNLWDFTPCQFSRAKDALAWVKCPVRCNLHRNVCQWLHFLQHTSIRGIVCLNQYITTL